MLCAMAFSAVVAQGASAAGQTAFTCASGGGAKDFSKAHCAPADAVTPGTGSFGHVAITEETHARLSNEKTNSTTTGPTNGTLRETIAGVELELESTGVVEGRGILRNEEVGGVMQAYAESNESALTFNGVIVKKPAGKGCIVREKNAGAEGVVKTRPVKGHTTVVTDKENGEGAAEERHSVIIEPTTGTVFASFWIECSDPSVPIALQENWEITGKVTCPTNGATINCNHNTITEANTLKGKGTKAGLQGKATITAGKFPESEPTNPISVTTTTP